MIKTENLCKTYGKGEGSVAALKNASLTIEDGELAAIIGKSGSGKTTLLNLLGCLDTATDGKAYYNDTEITALDDGKAADFRLRHIGFVFQFFDLLPELTAAENILLPARLAKKNADNYQAIVDGLGLTERVNHYPSQLSGGQQQRVAIARALINDPEVLLCDEPTGNLDEKSGKEVMDLLLKMNREQGKTILIVTHDPEIAAQCQRTIEISDGAVL
ncbi:MAG: ABC transporter ATP-binding protein [Oscillospiraceae bacterium]|nr:ABC transporter ATP-binding protein [Oscillospiraceae bacterium]